MLPGMSTGWPDRPVLFRDVGMAGGNARVAPLRWTSSSTGPAPSSWVSNLAMLCAWS